MSLSPAARTTIRYEQLNISQAFPDFHGGAARLAVTGLRVASFRDLSRWRPDAVDYNVGVQADRASRSAANIPQPPEDQRGSQLLLGWDINFAAAMAAVEAAAANITIGRYRRLGPGTPGHAATRASLAMYTNRVLAISLLSVAGDAVMQSGPGLALQTYYQDALKGNATPKAFSQADIDGGPDAIRHRAAYLLEGVLGLAYANRRLSGHKIDAIIHNLTQTDLDPAFAAAPRIPPST